MSKRDYEALAALIKAQRIDEAYEEWSQNVNGTLDELARDMAQYMASQNPRFDTDRFLAAAGVS